MVTETEKHKPLLGMVSKMVSATTFILFIRVFMSNNLVNHPLILTNTNNFSKLHDRFTSNNPLWPLGGKSLKKSLGLSNFWSWWASTLTSWPQKMDYCRTVYPCINHIFCWCELPTFFVRKRLMSVFLNTNSKSSTHKGLLCALLRSKLGFLNVLSYHHRVVW